MKNNTNYTRIFLVVFTVLAFVVSIYFITRQPKPTKVCMGEANKGVPMTDCECRQDQLITTSSGEKVKGFIFSGNSCFFCKEGETLGIENGKPTCVKSQFTSCDPNLSCEHQNSCNRCEKGYYCDMRANNDKGKCTRCTYTNIQPWFSKYSKDSQGYGHEDYTLNDEFSGKCYSDILSYVSLGHNSEGANIVSVEKDQKMPFHE